MANDDVAKRRAYRRKKARKKHMKSFFIVFLLFCIILGITLSLTVLFPIKKVSASGSKLYEQVHLEQDSGLIGENIFTVTNGSVEKKLRERYPYVDSVKITRKLPDTVILKVSDASEYYCYNVDGKLYAVSKKGIVLCEYKKQPKDLIIIKTKAVKCSIGKEIEFENDNRKSLVDTLINELKSYKIKINSIDVSDNNDIRLKVADRFEVMLGTNTFITNKCAHLNGMINNIGKDESGTINLTMWSNEKSEGTFIKGSEKLKK
ncbi:MAG: FtsQ-type POTRA domain-containing protein [Clostridia bacterium]|nr:FtsQ-type POTRA domain-containing protein [Clostridia bacterium]